MNPDVFFKNFELLADAPNGVQKLRELILQLAVMGKLVEQDPNDELASVCIEKIEAEKKQLVKGSKIKGSKSVNFAEPDQIPYEIPSSWEWTTLSECGLINPRNYVSDEKEISFVPMTFISERYGQKVETETRKWEEVKKGFTHFAENDVVLAKITPCFQNGKAAVMNGLKNGFGAGTTELHVFRPLPELISPNYVLIYLKSPDFIYNGIPKMTGSAGQKRVPKGYFSENPFPLPPLAEQKRIVSKVDELMSLCDKLEIRRQKKQEIQSKLNSAALDRMFSAENQEEFEHNWQRICENFDILYDNPENVGKLKQAILQLAVQGKLVEQNPEDEPASVLIEKIEAEEKKLLKEGKIQKAKNLQAVDVEEIPYNIPNGWLWIHFGKIAPHIEAGWSPMCEKRPKEGEEWGVLKISAVSWDVFNPSENKALPSNLNPRPEYEVKPNDFLMSRANTSELVGKSVIVEDTIPKLMISDKVLRLFFSSYSFKKYYNIFNNSQTARFYYAKEASGTSSSMKNISREVIYNMPVPLPPLEEQKRIFVKVEQLMGLCNELELKLRKEREDSEKLMETVVKGLLEGAAAEI